MKEFRITIDGKTYNVQVEEAKGIPAIQPAAQPVKAPVAAVPQPATPVPASQPAVRTSGSVCAPMPGTILKLLVAVGDAVKMGQPVLILDAMKMENNINASAAGVVKSIEVSQGQSVDTGQLLLTID